METIKKVFYSKGQRVRGPWIGYAVFYAQLDASDGQQNRYALKHAGTVPQAITARQVLKELQGEGKLLPSSHRPKVDGKAVTVARQSFYCLFCRLMQESSNAKNRCRWYQMAT